MKSIYLIAACLFSLLVFSSSLFAANEAGLSDPENLPRVREYVAEEGLTPDRDHDEQEFCLSDHRVRIKGRVKYRHYVLWEGAKGIAGADILNRYRAHVRRLEGEVILDGLPTEECDIPLNEKILVAKFPGPNGVSWLAVSPVAEGTAYDVWLVETSESERHYESSPVINEIRSEWEPEIRRIIHTLVVLAAPDINDIGNEAHRLIAKAVADATALGVSDAVKNKMVIEATKKADKLIADKKNRLVLRQFAKMVSHFEKKFDQFDASRQRKLRHALPHLPTKTAMVEELLKPAHEDLKKEIFGG